jgi:hypothetical protein
MEKLHVTLVDIYALCKACYVDIYCSFHLFFENLHRFDKD